MPEIGEKSKEKTNEGSNEVINTIGLNP